MRPLLPRWFTSRSPVGGGHDTGNDAAAAEPPVIDLFARPHSPVAPDGSGGDASREAEGKAAGGSFVVVQAVPARRLVVPEPLRLIDGRLHLHLGDGLVCPLRHGDPSGLLPGWSAATLYVGCDRLLWLSLVHLDGHATDWFLTEAGSHIADTVDKLPAPVRDRLVRHVQDLLAIQPGPDRDRAMDAYGRMHPRTRRAIELWIPGGNGGGAMADGAGGAPVATLPPQAGLLVSGSRLEPDDLLRPGVLAGTWRREDGHPVLLAGHRVTVALPLSGRPAHARLSLEVKGLPVPRRLTVSINGWTVGGCLIGPQHRHGTRLDYWIPAEALEAGTITVALDTAPESVVPAAALVLERVAFDLGALLPAGVPDAVPADDGALMAAFGSLGEDCEFGFVQRHFGIEPLGLFRFAGAGTMRNLLRLLDGGLDRLGEPGSLSAKLVDARLYRPPEPPLVVPEFLMTDKRLGFFFHTFRGPEQEPEADAIAANERKLRYLKRKFVEDLEDGEKIWVLKDGSRGDTNEAFAFLAALQRTGPNKLFWVTRVVEGRPSGSVEWIAPDLLRGYSGGSHHDAQVFDPAIWLRLCRNAYRAFAERDAVRSA